MKPRGAEKTVATVETARQRRPLSARFILSRDLYFLLLAPFLTALAWFFPRSVWPAFSRVVSRWGTWMFFANLDLRAQRLARRFKWPKHKAKSRLRTLAGEQLIWLLEILRSHRPFSEPPEVAVTGAEGPLAALASSKGVILWWSPSAHRDLVAKIGLKPAGLDIVHISRPGHGLSPSGFGRRVLNPILTRQENRWLKSRVVIDPHNPVGATLRLRKEVKAGGCVAIAAAVSRHRGASEPIRVKFLTGKFRFAPGAATLAERTGAALFPIVTVREGLGYRVIVGPNLNRKRDRNAEQLTRAFAKWNEGEIEKAPGQWSGWLQV